MRLAGQQKEDLIAKQIYNSMVITRTPFRISFFGGGTDYPAWYREHGGSVLSTSFNKYCYLICRYLPPFFEHKYRISYSIIETVKRLEEIEHPSVRAILSYLDFSKDRLEIHYNGDLPARSGLGSSSAFTVGLLNALKTLRGQRIDKQQLGKLAIHIEQNVIKEPVGSQDQIATSVGGLNRIDFGTDDSVVVRPVTLSPQRTKELESTLMLFFTGFSRYSSEIANSKIKNFNSKQKCLRTLHQMVNEGINILTNANCNIFEFGRLLHESWELKRNLSDKVTTSKIDEIYATALRAGCIGGKLLGAGGGGFMLLMAPKHLQEKVKQALHPLIHIQFKFENNGSQTVYL